MNRKPDKDAPKPPKWAVKSGDKPEAASRGRKAPRRLGATYLENAALHYLGRYASSVENFRRVMLRKINRSATFHNIDSAPFITQLEAMIGRYIKTGLLNDTQFAEAKTASLRRQGKSAQAIQAKLRAKGLPAGDIAGAIDTVDQRNIDYGLIPDEAEANAELAAALRLAQKKRLGRWRKTPLDADDHKGRQREMAALARAGFSFDIVKKVLQVVDDVD